MHHIILNHKELQRKETSQSYAGFIKRRMKWNSALGSVSQGKTPFLRSNLGDRYIQFKYIDKGKTWGRSGEFNPVQIKCRTVVSGCFVSLKCKRLLKPDLLFYSHVLCPLIAACLSEAAMSWLDSPCEWIAAQLLTNSPHSPLRKHCVTTPCVQSVGGGEQGGAGWVNRMGGWGVGGAEQEL